MQTVFRSTTRRPQLWEVPPFEHHEGGHPRQESRPQEPRGKAAADPGAACAGGEYAGAHPMHIEDLRLFENGVSVVGCIRPGVAPTPATSALLRKFVDYVFSSESLPPFLNDLLPIAEHARALAVLCQAQAVDYLQSHLAALGPNALLAKVHDEDLGGEPDFWVFGESLHAIVISALGQVHLQRAGNFDKSVGHAVGMRRVFIANGLDDFLVGPERR